MTPSTAPEGRLVEIEVDEAGPVSGLFHRPPGAKACLVLAHGAGAGMSHTFMAAVADGLGTREIATLRFQFPAMQAGRRRPDTPALAKATVRAGVTAATSLAPDLPLFAGGKSFGGRMTSQAQAQTPLDRVKGLVFFGFPLHPADKPSTARAAHLAAIQLPMLFLQGTRDALADCAQLRSAIAGLADADLVTFEDADHSFHVPVRSGRTDAETMTALLDAAATWMAGRLQVAAPVISCRPRDRAR